MLSGHVCVCWVKRDSAIIGEALTSGRVPVTNCGVLLKGQNGQGDSTERRHTTVTTTTARWLPCSSLTIKRECYRVWLSCHLTL